MRDPKSAICFYGWYEFWRLCVSQYRRCITFRETETGVSYDALAISNEHVSHPRTQSISIWHFWMDGWTDEIVYLCWILFVLLFIRAVRSNLIVAQIGVYELWPLILCRHILI